uniref:Uncharacterized protein n=1 Tax=Anguilla anguilla TaxID=7936 RepID=A0A0E9RTY9_ANGAN
MRSRQAIYSRAVCQIIVNSSQTNL